MLTSRNMLIFVLITKTTTQLITLSLAHARGVIIILQLNCQSNLGFPRSFIFVQKLDQRLLALSFMIKCLRQLHSLVHTHTKVPAIVSKLGSWVQCLCLFNISCSYEMVALLIGTTRVIPYSGKLLRDF